MRIDVTVLQANKKCVLFHFFSERAFQTCFLDEADAINLLKSFRVSSYLTF